MSRVITNQKREIIIEKVILTLIFGFFKYQIRSCDYNITISLLGIDKYSFFVIESFE